MKQLIVLDSTGGVAEASIEDIVASKKNNFRGWICETGIQSLYIDFDGHVWIGNCAGGVGKHLLRAGKPAWGHLGSITGGYTFATEFVVCPYSGCGCGSDIVVTKYKPTTVVIPLLKSTDGIDWQTNKAYSELADIQAVKMRHLGPKQVLWDIGRRCNYNCSYCWPDVHNTTDPHRTLEEFKSTADRIINEWSGGIPIRWYFGGGEPTLNPDFEPFVDYLAERGQWVMLVTNASQGPSYWAKNAGNYNVLLFSAHFEFMKPELFEKNYIRVIESIDSGAGRLDKFIVKLMTPASTIDRSIQFAERLKAATPLFAQHTSRVQFDIVPLRGSSGWNSLEYTDGELQKIMEWNQVNQ